LAGVLRNVIVDQDALEERNMLTDRKQVLGVCVEKGRQQWVVLDPEGNFWIVPSGDGSWDRRQPFHPTEETDLEPAPGHYQYLLGLPF
jgi:hypothetical protein